MIKLFILTRLNTVINLIVARPAKSDAVINIISKLWVIRPIFRAILPVLQGMFWSVESIVTELAGFGVLAHQYNYILNRGLSK